MSQSLAFVLESDELAGKDGHVFGGFPGVWTPGQPIEAQAFVDEGVFASVEEMQARVEELDLPLRAVKVKAGSAPMPERSNRATGETDAETEELETEPELEPEEPPGDEKNDGGGAE